MKIKTKLMLSLGLLFVMIILLTLASVMYVKELSNDTKNILVANYNTIDYSRKMMDALNNGIDNLEQAKLFQDNLNKQRKNITETGEEELTKNLSFDFENLKKSTDNSTLLQKVRSDISHIMLINMQAIQRKSEIAEKTSGKAVFRISMIGAFCFLIAFVMLVNIPGNIANPIKELTNSIKEIAAQNYSKRVNFETHDEFGDLASAFNTMAKKLDEYKASNLEKLMMEKKRIETLINNMHDPVIGLDEQCRILFMNDVALNITALKAEEVLGKPAQDIAVRNDLLRSVIQELFIPASTLASKAEPLKIYADDKESYFEKEIIPIKIIPTGEKEEKLIGTVIMLQNITPYKELDFAKTNFIAMVSHELKTPISSIKMSVHLLENEEIGSMNEEQKHLLDGIKDDAARLLKITSELLNMTQVESGVIQLSALPSDVKEILSYAVNANHIAAEQKHINLQVNIPESLPKVLADNEKTAWVVTNLVSNAIRYSHENSTVSLQAVEENGKIKLSISDTGQGIDPQYIDKIFDRYFRVPGSRKEGTGLGLSISKEFIEAQGGTIAVKSELGRGSTFIIILPSADSFS
ncbi:MAG: ATP-binding protein [Flavobacteriales bacterium]